MVTVLPQSTEKLAEDYFQEGDDAYRIGDKQRAADSFRKAAESGHAKAQFQLATMLMGQGNYLEAFPYLRNASSTLKAGALVLAFCNKHGVGLPRRNPEIARRWQLTADALELTADALG